MSSNISPLDLPPITLLTTTWIPGQTPPESHPLWEQQVELELAMLRSGADKFKDRVLVAESKGQATRVTALHHRLEAWVPAVGDTIRQWADLSTKSRGAKPTALKYVKAIEPNVAALIGVRSVLNALAFRRSRPQGLTQIAMDIGHTVEHEQRVRHWEKQQPGLYWHYEEELTTNRSTAAHRRKVNINRFNALVKEGSLQWDGWSKEVIFRVGVAVLDAVIKTTGWFEIQADPFHRAKRSGVFDQRLILAAKPEFTAWFAKALEHGELTSPDYKPTIMPPKRWTTTGDGGYYTPYVRPPRLVRFKASQEHQRDRAADEYDALDLSSELDAIHLLQETPWAVNGPVLDVVVKAWALDRGIGGLPQVSELPLPTRTPRMHLHSEAVYAAKHHGHPVPMPDPETAEEIQRWKREAAPVYRFNMRRVSTMRSTTATIMLAEEFRNYDRFYFPHMLDFRGRKYSIVSYLQPQGDDLSRGLLTFADGMPIADEADAGWLAVQLASSCGVDKVSFEDRIEWVYSREADWRRAAAEPLANTDVWSEADKPWQTLAAIFEWVGFLEEGYGFVSRLPIMQDGTCNGIQHLAALTRDAGAGAYVNLVPSDKPQDIYKHVAEGLDATLRRISLAGGEEGAKAQWWLDECGGEIPRSLTKRQVMVLPYGGTKDSYFKYTREWLDESSPVPDYVSKMGDGERAEWFSYRSKLVGFMVMHMWDEVNRVASDAMSVMKWLQTCAKQACIDNQPIYWITPTGFVVRHFYGVVKTTRVELMLDGERVQLNVSERTNKLSTKEQLQGISPNFIHSLDASALTETLRLCREAGITAFASVHDAYGTHAANMWPLSRMLREGFVHVHQTNPLESFRAACVAVVVASRVEAGEDVLEAAQNAEAKMPPVPPHGQLILEQVLQSDYFFA